MSNYLDARPVLITGATGFIGRQLVTALLNQKATVYALTRNIAKSSRWPQAAVTTRPGDLVKADSLMDVCAGIDTVFHLAGYSGSDSDSAADDAHWQVTVEGTRALLAQAQQAGVRRFVFVSSVKAMGEGGVARLDESSPAVPISPYGRAKLEAEKLVLDASNERRIHVCVLRLPMVYGRDNQGNIPRMIAAVDRGWFPPLSEVNNKRSMVHVDDVVQAALLAATNPNAVGKVYIVTDGQTYSTRQIYEWICAALQRPVPRWSFPVGVLRVAARAGDMAVCMGIRSFPLNSEALEKLIGSAWYSSEKISHELGYRPVHTLQDALPEMVAEFRKNS